MFEIMIATFYYAFYIGLSGIIVLFLLRLYMGMTLKLNRHYLLMLLFIPGSIGLALKMKEDYPLKKTYHALSIFFFIAMVIGSIFLLYMKLELNIL
ncbi:MAG: hypothetical protein A2Y45_06635 [Tenericutes bacterium GWC2_34_14]|nr:MAG: hypothetical protein A2Z84_04335 [Tenericutes bacterium GWA2_35_7]OHE28625.1 MAG: hypothetical protein A2Y45_06635 [Tenericutes bacterium GWC2_34_14]OHE33467.1 MAG: hypothetical protein A2012_03175 [Tenericutes bacterium GWE2_34_108]OHE36752.1 MAG: hypothetical protein A2Y46_08975 [Tenericutes bacterium GWF1_35_14]OHE38168.1 MAG: hypothetical protein A2Y44_09690 [Tenericutes bacterium GWF2_35_184]OHE43314.1 MAG: hypothetical protein A2221_06045 [Tenericutes bacterium RIFOXYA2_FULL_36_3